MSTPPPLMLSRYNMHYIIDKINYSGAHFALPTTPNQWPFLQASCFTKRVLIPHGTLALHIKTRDLKFAPNTTWKPHQSLRWGDVLVQSWRSYANLLKAHHVTHLQSFKTTRTCKIASQHSFCFVYFLLFVHICFFLFLYQIIVRTYRLCRTLNCK